jgi:hypothetical protein
MGEAVRQARCWAQEPADEPDAAPLELESTARIDEPGEKAGTVG